MQLQTQMLSLTIFGLFLIYSEFKLVSGMELSRAFQDKQLPDTEMDTERMSQPELEPLEVQRRTCHGFPCMYSHLGTKAGRASLYKTLASFIDECFSDPNCDPVF